MIEKYQDVMDSAFQYAYNSIQVVSDDRQLAKEIIAKFPTFICYFKCDNEMIEEFVYQTVRTMRKTRDILLDDKIVNETNKEV